MLPRFLAVLLTSLASLLFLACQAFSAEVINRFDSDVKVASNGILTVTETINVTAEGRDIRRGIYRDFPLLFEDPEGNRRQVDFELVSVKKDGEAEPYFTENRSRYIRIYIGDADVFLTPGPYTYEITYRTGRQIRFFENHDELYWNVTGNGWSFPMQNVKATVVLPPQVAAMDTVAYTGAFGSTEQAASTTRSPDGNQVEFRTTRVLQPYEGLTFAIKMPKGSIAAPTLEQEARWFWRDNLNNIIAIGILVVVSAYYFLNWWRIGRDPPKGVIVPRWTPPDNISPAQVNYIDRKGLSGKGWSAMASAILNLAVKGRITIDKFADDLHLEMNNGADAENLPVGEAAIMRRIKLAKDGIFVVSKKHGSKVKKLQQGFASAMETEHRGKFYEHNTSATVVGVFLSIAGLVALFFFGRFSEDTIAGFIFGGFFSVFLSIFLIVLGKRFAAGGGLARKLSTVITFGLFAFFVGSFAFRALPFLFDLFDIQPVLFTALVGIVVLNILFYFLLGAPTMLGRQLMDGIEGLKTYLELAEKDRMNLKDAPDFSVKHYEELLPYAIALGVEEPWTRSFEKWLAAAVAAGTVAASYQPGWYRGRDFSVNDITDDMGGLSESIQNSFSDAMPVPKSSSSGFSGGGGGGYSGGGGGGGGGGGW